MRESLVNRVEHQPLLGSLSITAGQALPTVVGCPVCRQPNTLDVMRSGGRTLYRCRNRHNCGFQGDGLLLYAMATQQDLRSSCLELLAGGVIPPSSTSLTELDNYLADHQQQSARWITFWKDAQSEFCQARSYTRSLLQRMGIWESGETTCGLRGLGGLLGAATGSQLLDLELNRHDRQWIKSGRTYLLLPMWTVFGRISGFTCWTADLEWAYLQVGHGQQGERGIGLLENYQPASDLLFLCENPLHALHLTDLGHRSGQTFPVLYVDRLSTAHQQLTARQQVLVLSSDSMDHYRQALQRSDCRVCRPQDVANSYCTTAESRQTELLNCSRPAHQALADCLSTVEQTTAQVMAQCLRLDQTDIARVLSAVPPGRQERLRQVLEGQADMQSVKFGQVEILCQNDGWSTAKHGQILNCMFFIDRLVYDPDNRQGVAQGVLIKDGQQYEFSSPLRDVRTRTLDWLTDLLLRNCGGLPICLPGWANKLFNISLLFRQPQTTHSSNTMGWTDDNRRLTLPQLVVVGGQLHVNPAPPTTGVPGQALVLGPEPSIEHVRNLAFDDRAGACFWALFCGLCINLWAPLHGRGTFGLGLINPRGRLLGQLADQARQELGLPALDFSTASGRRLEELKERERHAALPYYVEQEWHKAEGFRRWLRHQGDRNCLVEMSLPTALGTSLDGGWIYLRDQHKEQEGATRLLGCWSALPHFLAWTQQEGLSFGQTKSDLPRAVLNAVGDWFASRWGVEFRPNASAQQVIRLDPLDRLASRGSKILSFIIENAEAGLVRLHRSEQVQDVQMGLISDKDSETLFVSHRQLTELFDECGVTPPTGRELTDALEQAQLLKGRTYKGCRGYALDQSQYNFLWAIRQASY